MEPLTEIIVIVLLIIANIMALIYLIQSYRADSRYIKYKERIAVCNHNLKQIRRLKEVADDFTMLENEIRFIITLPTVESRINRFNILDSRYTNLVLKIIEVITDEKPTMVPRNQICRHA